MKSSTAPSTFETLRRLLQRNFGVSPDLFATLSKSRHLEVRTTSKCLKKGGRKFGAKIIFKKAKTILLEIPANFKCRSEGNVLLRRLLALLHQSFVQKMATA